MGKIHWGNVRVCNSEQRPFEGWELHLNALNALKECRDKNLTDNCFFTFGEGLANGWRMWYIFSPGFENVDWTGLDNAISELYEI